MLNHANPSTLAMYDEIANVVTDTPIIGGAEAQDPDYLTTSAGWSTISGDTGFDGLINFPTTGPERRRGAERASVGLGLARDFEMVEIARARDYFTICYGYTEEQTAAWRRPAATSSSPHAGWTKGGLAGGGRVGACRSRRRASTSRT